MNPLLTTPIRRRANAFSGPLAAALLVILILAHGPAAAAASAETGAPRTAAQQEGTQYALIINGDDSFTHNYNVRMAIETLPHLGYAAGHTLLLAAGKPNGEDPAIRRMPATTDGIDRAVALLQHELRPQDVLLVYMTGHGGRAFGRTFLSLESGMVTASAFLHRLAPLPFARLILIADQCYSGGFLDEALRLGRDVVGVASADSRHEVRCEPFIRPLWQAAVGAPDAGAGSALVSVEQAYRVGADSLAKGVGQGEAENHPQYVATGRCQGHQNGFGIETTLH
jgi:hypothetical protein